ncbi:hypothetical protein NDU88_004621 [Pleurodeles waltl]|uniref:Uncharacterized protein n=1 Tax=Pleurodeles waltl TaxID=8319 RepID=A0AAV7LIU3_PLEWA|nr:hypothetical protein NDU88_004621 [Pleurodeles waltl]
MGDRFIGIIHREVNALGLVNTRTWKKAFGSGTRKSDRHQGHCDGLHQSDPHSDLACADTAPNITDAPREDGLPIGSLTPPRELKVGKKRLPPFHGESNGCWSWCTKESTGDEERKPKEDAAPEDAETALRMSGPT